MNLNDNLLLEEIINVDKQIRNCNNIEILNNINNRLEIILKNISEEKEVEKINKNYEKKIKEKNKVNNNILKLDNKAKEKNLNIKNMIKIDRGENNMFKENEILSIDNKKIIRNKNKNEDINNMDEEIINGKIMNENEDIEENENININEKY